MQKETAESLRQRLQEEQERLAEYDLLELIVVNTEIRDGRKIFPSTPKSSRPSLSFNPKVVFMPHCMFDDEEKEAELAELRLQECSDDEESGDTSTPTNGGNTPRTRPKRHSFGDLQDAPLAAEAPKLEVQSSSKNGRQKSEKFHDKLSRARLAKTREKARELGGGTTAIHDHHDDVMNDEPKLGDLSFDEKSGRVTDKYSRVRLARMHRSATGGTLARVPDAEFLAEGRARALTPFLELHVMQSPPRDEISTKLVSTLQAADNSQLISQLQGVVSANLQRCELDDAMVVMLARALENCSLASLDLNCNLFGDSAASALGNMLKVHSSLTSLDLSGNDLKDPLLLGEGLKVNRALQSLYLIDCPITQNASDIVSLRSALEVQMLLRKGQVGTTIHLDSVTTLTVPFIDASQAVRWYLSVEQPDPPTVHSLLVSSRISIEDIFRRSPKAESLLYALIPMLRLERSADKELIKVLALAKIFSKLNSSDISYRDMCSAPIRAFIDGCTHFCGRFLLQSSSMPEFESFDRVIFRATDSQIKAEVLIVLYASEARYRQEKLRQVGLEPSSILQVIFGCEDFPQWRENVQRLCNRSHPWGVVMPAFQRSLLQIVQQEPWNIAEIKQVVKSIARCLSHVHSMGRIHGNVTPRHVVRMADKTFKLMGLEAMVAFGVPCGDHTASAYCPPELALLRADGVAPGLVLPATASFDMWGLGVVLFRLLRRAPLFCADDAGELWGVSARTSLETWGIESLGETLHQLARHLRPLPLSDQDRLAACDLLGALLQRQGHVRPSCEWVLAHPFLQTGDEIRSGWLMSIDHVHAALDSVKAGSHIASTSHYSLKFPLHLAAEYGQLSAVQSLLEQKAALDSKDVNGRTPLDCLLQSRPHDQLTDAQLRVCRHLCKELHIDEFTSLGFSEAVLHKLRQLSGPQLGDTLRVKTNAGERTGVVKFLGKTSFAADEWIGMDLGTATGKNDGSVQGVVYFSCAPQQGIFVQHLAVLENLGKVGLNPVKKAEVRGECDMCRNPVTTDDQRMRTPEGNYRHLSCQPLPDLSSVYNVNLIESNMLGTMVPQPTPVSGSSDKIVALSAIDERERAVEERERLLEERERLFLEKQDQFERGEDKKTDRGRPRKPSPSPTRPVAREGIHLRPATVGAECEFVPRHGVVWGGMICAKCGVRRKDHRLVPPKPEPRR